MLVLLDYEHENEFFLLLLALIVSPLLAYDGDMDVYHEFKEDLALVRDSYLVAFNVAQEESGEKTEGLKTWAQIEFEAPECQYLKVTEIPQGLKLKGSHGAYKVEAEVRVEMRGEDIFYDVKFLKGSNAPGKEIFGEVFRN